MKISTGTSAPTFELETLTGKISLSELLSTGDYLFISFHRFGACPVCNLHIRSLINNSETLSGAGIKILVVFESSVEILKASIEQQHPPFPVGSDPIGHLYKLYNVQRSTIGLLKSVGALSDVFEAKKLGVYPDGVSRDGHPDRMPADFLIGKDGKVILSHYGSHAGDHLSVTKIVEAVNGNKQQL